MFGPNGAKILGVVLLIVFIQAIRPGGWLYALVLASWYWCKQVFQKPIPPVHSAGDKCGSDIGQNLLGGGGRH